jgi:hypothetical protein
MIPIYVDMRIGAARGGFGASQSHGQYTVTVHKLVKADEDGRLIDEQSIDATSSIPAAAAIPTAAAI